MFLTVHSVDQSIRRSRGSDLPAYNQLVVQHQDEAFTLACDLLGDESRAAAAVEAAFRDAYRDGWRIRPDFRLGILKKVVAACLKQAKILPGPAPMAHLLTGLTNTEKAVLVLVDCLELSYTDAAYVMDNSTAAVRQSLARARFSLSGALKIK